MFLVLLKHDGSYSNHERTWTSLKWYDFSPTHAESHDWAMLIKPQYLILSSSVFCSFVVMCSSQWINWKAIGLLRSFLNAILRQASTSSSNTQPGIPTNRHTNMTIGVCLAQTSQLHVLLWPFKLMCTRSHEWTAKPEMQPVLPKQAVKSEREKDSKCSVKVHWSCIAKQSSWDSIRHLPANISQSYLFKRSDWPRRSAQDPRLYSTAKPFLNWVRKINSIQFVYSLKMTLHNFTSQVGLSCFKDV